MHSLLYPLGADIRTARSRKNRKIRIDRAVCEGWHQRQRRATVKPLVYALKFIEPSKSFGIDLPHLTDDAVEVSGLRDDRRITAEIDEMVPRHGASGTDEFLTGHMVVVLATALQRAVDEEQGVHA